MTIEELEKQLNECQKALAELKEPKCEHDWKNVVRHYKVCKKCEEVRMWDEEMEELAELKESKKEGKWKPKIGEKYWFRSTDNLIGWLINNHQLDEWRINNIPIFKTKEECKRYWHFMDTVREKSYSFSKEEWEDDTIEKFYICHDFDKFNEEDEDFIVLEDVDYKHCGSIYFKTSEDAQYIIDNFKDELMEFWI